MRPTSGQVLLHGKDIWAEPKKIRDVRFQVGLVFQYPEYQLFEETVYKDIAFGPINQGKTGEELDRCVREAARLVGIRDDVRPQAREAIAEVQKAGIQVVMITGDRLETAVAIAFSMEDAPRMCDFCQAYYGTGAGGFEEPLALAPAGYLLPFVNAQGERITLSLSTDVHQDPNMSQDHFILAFNDLPSYDVSS